MDKTLKKIADELGIILSSNTEPPGFMEWVDEKIKEDEAKKKE